MADKAKLQRDLDRALRYYQECKEEHQEGRLLWHEVESVGVHVANILLAAIENYNLQVALQDTTDIDEEGE